MPRTRSFATVDAVRAARDQFWRHGYEATSMADLERVTALNRSSIYQAFGSKRALFDRAVDNYLDEVAAPRLAGLEAPGAGVAEIAGYLEGLASVLAAGPDDIARRGCLVVNTITELAGHDPAARAVGARYRERLRSAFAGALTGRAAAGRADLVTGVVIGVLVTACLDPAAAAALARSAAIEVAGWT